MIFSSPHLSNGLYWAGMRIGLLGGSFNPPHTGHRHISLLALKTLRLDAVWWLVTPQNPLKDSAILMSYEKRMALCEKLVQHPRIIVTDIEKQLGLNRTFDTLKALQIHFPATSFVWVTGMDNALTFHKWYRWREILDLVPTAHVARPPAWTLIRQCPLKQLRTQNHFYLDRAAEMALTRRTTFWILQKKMLEISSTEIRKLTLKQQDI